MIFKRSHFSLPCYHFQVDFFFVTKNLIPSPDRWRITRKVPPETNSSHLKMMGFPSSESPGLPHFQGRSLLVSGKVLPKKLICPPENKWLIGCSDIFPIKLGVFLWGRHSLIFREGNLPDASKDLWRSTGHTCIYCTRGWPWAGCAPRVDGVVDMHS